MLSKPESIAHQILLQYPIDTDRDRLNALIVMAVKKRDREVNSLLQQLLGELQSESGKAKRQLEGAIALLTRTRAAIEETLHPRV
ncbi:MAG: hypothetical protein KME27_10725 [Lyngbya sp. HA4199-MV5]|jgi:hypothetical protein|nr:hypothetical protein [Lyngbya sp. HA4199-MV5]